MDFYTHHACEIIYVKKKSVKDHRPFNVTTDATKLTISVHSPTCIFISSILHTIAIQRSEKERGVNRQPRQQKSKANLVGILRLDLFLVRFASACGSTALGFGEMGSLLGDWPSYNPHNFSQLRPSDPAHPSQLAPATYCPTHNRTTPPAHQVISTETTNILLRQFYQRAEEKLKTKRPASDPLVSEHTNKHLKSSCGDDIKYAD